MSANKRIVIIFSIAILIAISAIWFSAIDPFYKTDIKLSAVITKKVLTTGKQGGVVEITAKIENGDIYYFKTTNYNANEGDTITLYLHKRKISGLSKYAHN
ncbi:MAG: hypothetical protein OQK75_09360 [Gammaproteobacteria bacterium]|nr:hypothetical protein [Gammaproteobacteria bacterium]MCW9032339.1 hypothetical protein [Gammaproteobacteria bacterium]